jgi:hypothetical protein
MPTTKSSAAADCDWNNNNLACVNTWAFLRGLKELRPSFSGSKDITMSELAFWNKVATPELRQLEASALAARLDAIFVKALLAKYESGFNFASAVEALGEALATADLTVCQLSLVVDEAYNFRGELK